ncbi:MAG: hypothetical protein MUF34_20640 [Polyangiaceae bacterium]|jgi:hypothetical protein|nr:hypothetical protein [Polyangiaceae bacterium]
MARRVLRSGSLAALAALVTVASAALTGCGDLSSYSVPHAAGARAPREGPVAVFASYDPHVGRELGAVVVRGGHDDDVRELFPELVRRVQELGGNALVIDNMRARFELVSPWANAGYWPAACGPACSRGVASPAPLEIMTIELRGRALWVSPDELARVEGRAP